MKYCTKCGSQIHDEAVICVHCGCAVEGTVNKNRNTDDELLKTLSERVKIDAIIWLVIGIIQIVTGAFFIVGILNIISAINDLKYSKEVLDNPTGIVERYEPLTMPIIVLVYNAIFGGVIGIAGSIYYFVAIRNFVMENKAEFGGMPR